MARYIGVLKIIAGISLTFYSVAVYGPVLGYYDKLETLSGLQEWLPAIAFVVPLLWGIVFVGWGAKDIAAGIKKGNKNKKKSKGKHK